MFPAMPLFVRELTRALSASNRFHAYKNKNKNNNNNNNKTHKTHTHTHTQENGEVHETNKKSIGILLYKIVQVLSHGSENWLNEFAYV